MCKKKIQGLPLVIYFWKKLQGLGLPLVIYICENNTRLTPCDLFVNKIQGLPLVIFLRTKYKAYPL